MIRNNLIACLLVLSLPITILTSCDNDKDNDESGNTRTITVKNVATLKSFVQSGTFQATGDTQLILPGEEVEIKFNAGKGQALSFATMYGNSKDLFFAPNNPGIQLFDGNGNAIEGDVSAQVKLWDNGTIINSNPENAASDQPTVAEDRNISEINGSDGMYTYPAANEMMKLNLKYDINTSMFTLTIKNNSDRTNVSTPFSPGVWAVSNVLGGNLLNTKPFYEENAKTTASLTALSTTGNNQPFKNMLTDETGIITGISPVLVVLYTGDTNPIFTVNEKDKGNGLKNLAQTGDASILKTSLEKERIVKKVYVLGSSPIAPGSKVDVKFETNRNEKIAIATMFGYSNDWFYANNSQILATATGDITNHVSLYDNGTAKSQYPGAGNAQALFSNKQIAEDIVIKMVDSQTYPDFPVPAVNDIIQITIN